MKLKMKEMKKKQKEKMTGFTNENPVKILFVEKTQAFGTNA